MCGAHVRSSILIKFGNTASSSTKNHVNYDEYHSHEILTLPTCIIACTLKVMTCGLNSTSIRTAINWEHFASPSYLCVECLQVGKVQN